VDSAPAIFTLDASGKGQAAMLNETGCCNSARNPATRGTIASLYATGEGSPPLHVKIVVGGVPAEVLYASNVGELTVNFRVPSTAPVGDAVPLVLVAGNLSSADGVTMAIRSSDRGVLVVDHEAPIRSRLAETLKKAGYEVFTARDVQEARAQSKEHPVDLVITDLALPEEAGLETIDTIRKEHPRVKIIVLSAEAGPRILRAADILGAQTVLRKPLKAGVVVERVRDLLRERPARY
jgi:CheY-like chemotaxis protein